MKFERLKHRVERAEQLVEGRASQTRDHWQSLTTTWRDSWTPLRIVVAGLVSGFIVGRSDPMAALGKLGGLGGARWIQAISAISGLVASFQASAAADKAGDAADKADDAVDEAQQQELPLPDPPARDRTFNRSEFTTQPAPAEAATEMSER